MSKKKFIKADIEQLKTDCKRMLDNSFFRLWMNRYDFPELGRKEKRMIMKSFWNDGTISCGQIKHMTGPESLFFTGWMTQNYDYMYEPEIVRFVNTRGVPFIPMNEQVVNETAVLGWANSGRNSIKSLVGYFIERMVECELILHNNLITSQVNMIVNITPEEKLKAQDLIDRLLNFEPVVFTEGEINAVQSIISNGATWIADKIRSMYYDYQSQVFSILGIDNTKMDGSNKQFVLTEQLDSNIAEINLYKTDIDNTIQEFLDDIQETFGITITKVDNLPETTSMYEGADGEDKKQPTLKEGEDNGNN